MNGEQKAILMCIFAISICSAVLGYQFFIGASPKSTHVYSHPLEIPVAFKVGDCITIKNYPRREKWEEDVATFQIIAVGFESYRTMRLHNKFLDKLKFKEQEYFVKVNCP